MRSTVLVRAAGEALFGTRWQTDLSRELGMSDRNMRRLAAGEHEMSPSLRMLIADMLDERRDMLEQLAAELRRP